MSCGAGRDQIVDRNICGIGALGFFLSVDSFVMPFVMFGARSMFFFVKSKRGMMLGTLVRGIGFRFGTTCRATLFDLGGFIIGQLGNLGVCFLRFVFRLVFLFLDFFLFFKNRITGESGNLRNFLYFLLLGFDKPGPQCRDLIVV